MTLRKGMSGDAVKQLQTALKNFDYYMFGDIVVDGIYGTGTETAVRGFQSVKNLTADGIAGPQTLAALGLTALAAASVPVTTTTQSSTPTLLTPASGFNFMSMFESVPKPVLYGSIGVVVLGVIVLATRKRA